MVGRPGTMEAGCDTLRAESKRKIDTIPAPDEGAYRPTSGRFSSCTLYCRGSTSSLAMQNYPFYISPLALPFCCPSIFMAFFGGSPPATVPVSHSSTIH